MAAPDKNWQSPTRQNDGLTKGMKDFVFGSTGPRGGKRDGIVQSVAKSAVRLVTNSIISGILGRLKGKRW